jgi:hypothetical protein
VRHAAGASAERPGGYGPTHSASLSTFARCERPCRRAAEQRDELAACNQSIISSARIRTDWGMMIPRALAVL